MTVFQTLDDKFFCGIRFIVLFICISSSPMMLAQDEDENSGSPEIISETAGNSADIHPREEEQGPVPEEEKKIDKERKMIGMGELIKLKLNGKNQLIGDV